MQGGRWRVPQSSSQWGLVLALLGSACGKVVHNAEVAAGGSSSSDGGAGGFAGARTMAGAIELEAGAADACIAYALAVCTRQAECSHGSADRCLETAAAACPDLVFSAGATRSVAGLLGCAKSYAALSCDDINAEVLPPCVTPGTLPAGEPCKYASQCQTLTCKIAGDCGACATSADIGQSCAAPDVACGPHSVCGASQTCLPTSGPLYLPGQACTADWPCSRDYFCQDICLPLPQLGESCEGIGQCATGAYCSDEQQCLPLPGAGEPCGLVPRDAPSAYFCDEGLGCDVDASSTSGTCRPLPRQGETCLVTAELPGNPPCGPFLHCNDAVTPAVCATQAGLTEPCDTFWDCEPGLMCACPPAVPDCPHPQCLQARVGGERCDEPNTACHPAFRCESGVCVQGGLRSLFADACRTD